MLLNFLLNILIPPTYDVLSDPRWQAWGVILSISLGIPSLVIAIIALRKQRIQKEVAYKTISDTLLFDPQKEIERRFQFDGKEISNLRLVILKISNSGDMPILPGEFIEPVTFLFGSQSEILDAEVIEKKPCNLKVVLKPDVNTLTLAPLLLNKGETIKLKILLSGVSEKVRVESRIVGLQEIIDLNAEQGRIKIMSSLLSGLTGIGILASSIFLSYITSIDSHSITYSISQSSMIFLIMSLIGVSVGNVLITIAVSPYVRERLQNLLQRKDK
jgi:hypothetical protein